jgi:hypothetical protein
VQPDISTQKVQPQGLQLLLEASMKYALKILAYFLIDIILIIL